MPQFSSADPASKAWSRWPVIRVGGRPAFRYDVTVRVSLWASVGVVTVLFGWGAWQRRWIADDGLIVLRTVRNLLAGNGPVFNAGERVEANTSVVWTYLVYAGSWLTWPMRLEYVALVLALGLSLAGLALLMLGTGRLFAPSLLGRRAIMLPAGALVYVAVPPARDFATSGLESGLVMAYLGLLWWMLVCWSQAGRSREAGPVFIVALAFVAGCSVLVRPELALIGGLALIMMLIVAQGWQRRLTIVVAGGLLPVGYQIFRMGYYGLLFPGTALAKDAGGDKWSQGLIYLSNFNAPYALWVPVLLLAGLGLVLWASARRHKSSTGRKGADPTVSSRGPLARTVQSPTAIVAFILVSGLLQALYWIRQGGDFMHGRVLLAPLFCLLAPVAVVPVAFPEGTRLSREAGYWLAGGVSALWMAIAGWALYAANSSGLGDDATRVTYSGIVDERRFYAQATGHAHPLTAADYLDYPRMRAVLVALNNTPDGALLLPSGNYDQWDLVPPVKPLPPGSNPPPAPQKGPHAVFFTNLGMVGMNVGLDVRVIDQIGLANPLAAHTARLQHGRIGHDKNLFPDWVIADGPWVKWYPGIPGYLDEKFVQQATAALKCPATEHMLNSVRAPMGFHRFVSNFLHSYEFTKYRIDRVPRYELIRCGLDVPDSGGAPYTGLPATGP